MFRSIDIYNTGAIHDEGVYQTIPYVGKFGILPFYMSRGREFYVSINGTPHFLVNGLYEFEKGYLMTVAECRVPSEEAQKIKKGVLKCLKDEKRAVLGYKDRRQLLRRVTITDFAILQPMSENRDEVRFVVLLSEDDVIFSDVTNPPTQA